jgi:integrating conjugative element protein (TIGR03746 family)
MSEYLNALSAQRRANGHLRTALYIVAAMGLFGTWYAGQVPKNIDVHLLPAVSTPSNVKVNGGESVVPSPNVYAFGYYVWQQVNRWATDGATDYGHQIFRVQNYVTPRCINQLTSDMQTRQKAGELRQRTRQMSEIPGLGYQANRVVADDSGMGWTVFLDLQVQETYRGQAVKDVFIRYPIRIVRFDVDRQRNPWQMALDCYGSQRPARLDEAQIRQVPGAKPVEPHVPPVPASVEPLNLPNATPIGEGEVGTLLNN